MEQDLIRIMTQGHILIFKRSFILSLLEKTKCHCQFAVSRPHLSPTLPKWTCMIRDHLRRGVTPPQSPPPLRRICSQRFVIHFTFELVFLSS